MSKNTFSKKNNIMLNSGDNGSNFFQRFLKPFMAVGSTAIIAQTLVMLQNWIVARWLGPEVNAYALATFNIVIISFILVNWGFDHWLIQQTSFDPNNSHDNFSKVITNKLVFGIFVGTILLIALPKLRSDIYIPLYLIIILLDVISESLSNAAYSYFLATNRFKRSSVILTIARALRLLSTLALIAFKIKNLSWFLAFRLITSFGVLIYLWISLKPKLKLRSPKTFFQSAKQALPFGIAEILNTFYDHIDLTILAFLTLNKTEISYYGVAVSLLLAGNGILQSLQHMLVPYIIQQDQSKTYKTKKSLYLPPFLILLGSGLIGMLIFAFFGKPLIPLIMGEAYAKAGVLIKLASPLILFKAINVALSAILISRKQESLKLVPLGIVSLLKVAGTLLVYKPYGLEGMIVVFITSEFVLALLYTIQLIKNKNKNHSLSMQRPMDGECVS